MVKTHVQIPDDLYRSAKEIAKEKEWSFAEVVRRGLEYMDRVHHVEPEVGEWEIPVVKGLKPITDQDLKSAIDNLRDEGAARL